jgi:hypothetical protein
MGQIITPVRIPYAEIDLSWMVGRAVSEVSFLEPTLWRFSLGPREHIAVECLWRLIRCSRVVRCSSDHGRQFGLPAPVDAAQEAAELLSATSVSAVQLRKATADIRLDFSGDVCVEIIPDSSGYESWQVYAPGGVCFVAQGGGQICTWTQ